jgi:hypothetical protein
MAGLLQILGAAAITTGAALMSPAAGFAVGGFFLLLIGVAVERAKSAE